MTNPALVGAPDGQTGSRRKRSARRLTFDRVSFMVVFLGLLASYLLAVTTGLPVFHPNPERVEGLALATKAIETVGVLAAWSLLRRPHASLTLQQPKGTLT